MKNSKEYFVAECKAREESIGYPFKSEFESGFDFAMSQPKHIFDGVAKAGEVRSFEGKLVDVVDCGTVNKCDGCCLYDLGEDICNYIDCTINNVKYIARAK